MSDLLLINDFLEPGVREPILAELRGASGSPASTYGKGPSREVDSRIRKATFIVPSVATRDFVLRQLQQAMRRVAEHFATNLTQCEEPQFLRYEVGGHFVAHQDGNTPLIVDDSRFRKVSSVLILSARSATPEHGKHGGGMLVIHGRYPEFDVRSPVLAEPGTLVVFRSETTHEVTPVTHGERYTIASWYR